MVKAKRATAASAKKAPAEATSTKRRSNAPAKAPAMAPASARSRGKAAAPPVLVVDFPRFGVLHGTVLGQDPEHKSMLLVRWRVPAGARVEPPGAVTDEEFIVRHDAKSHEDLARKLVPKAAGESLFSEPPEGSQWLIPQPPYYEGDGCAWLVTRKLDKDRWDFTLRRLGDPSMLEYTDHVRNYPSYPAALLMLLHLEAEPSCWDGRPEYVSTAAYKYNDESMRKVRARL